MRAWWTLFSIRLNDLGQTLAEQTNADFAYNCYRRLQMFADVVYGISRMSSVISWDILKECWKQAKDFTGRTSALIDQYKAALSWATIKPSRKSSKEQLYVAIKAVFKSWNNPRAEVYHPTNDIPHDFRNSGECQAMVFRK